MNLKILKLPTKSQLHPTSSMELSIQGLQTWSESSQDVRSRNAISQSSSQKHVLDLAFSVTAASFILISSTLGYNFSNSKRATYCPHTK